MGRLMKSFERFVQLKGFAETAYHLGYRDTGAIKNWLKRGSIPVKQIANVKQMLASK